MNDIGRERYATVNGQECTVYLSLMTDEKGLERRDHCYRYGRPSHEVIPKDAEVVFGDFVEDLKGGHLPEEKRYTHGLYTDVPG